MPQPRNHFGHFSRSFISFLRHSHQNCTQGSRCVALFYLYRAGGSKLWRPPFSFGWARHERPLLQLPRVFVARSFQGPLPQQAAWMVFRMCALHTECRGVGVDPGSCEWGSSAPSVAEPKAPFVLRMSFPVAVVSRSETIDLENFYPTFFLQ